MFINDYDSGIIIRPKIKFYLFADVSDCINTISQDACKCIHRADLPTHGTFLLKILIVSLEDRNQTKILHTQEALIMGSKTQRMETVKICNQLYKKDQKKNISS